ncbi:MAG TPA: hypothetical protein VFV31_07945 [Chitinophagaceae bacterium]|nr:hypothetical protein [Chitinophagaceae bacterium]
MKKKNWHITPWLFLFSAVLSIQLASCDAYNFSQPQPADRENMYVFPDEMLGKWKEDTFTTEIDFSVPLNNNSGDKYYDNTQPLPADENEGVYIITKHYVSLIFTSGEKIVKGAWPQLTNGNEFRYPDRYFSYYKVMQTISYDSLKHPVDTTDNYILYRHKIYEKTQDRLLEKGYSYYSIGDTIVVLKKDTLTIDLGQNAFLRKLNASLYVLNIKNGILSDEMDPAWWKVILLQITADDKIVQWEPASKSSRLGCMFYERPSKSDYFYFDCQWSSDELLRLKAEGYFEKGSTLIRTKD